MNAAPRNSASRTNGVSLPIVEFVLSNMPLGTLTLTRPDGTVRRFEGALPGPRAQVSVTDPRAARRVVTGGSIGLAEAYSAGEWDTPDLASVLELGLANIDRSTRVVPTPARPLQRLWHRMRANTPRGSKRNISHHYDLGNDFYKLWLDDDMTYSSALFCSPEDPECVDLERAQQAKWDRVLDIVQPSRNTRMLEIGCGWGGFAIHAAKQAQCRVTGLTLSQEQHDWAMKRVAEEGLEDRVEIRLQDYRDIRESFDAIASIEMFEAVGQRYWSLFFGRIQELLARSGRAAIQTITIADERFERYRSKPDFIQRYIFPGGMLPSPERFKEVAEKSGLVVGEPRFFGESYARTLEHWLERFDGVHDQVLDMGFDERFVRMWRYYLAYCRTGFRAGTIDVMQVGLDRGHLAG